ncbi:hypothetical protein FQZ97_805430 [compost metagenome]
MSFKAGGGQRLVGWHTLTMIDCLTDTRQNSPDLPHEADISTADRACTAHNRDNICP